MRRTDLRQHAFKIIYQFPFHRDFDPGYAAEIYLSELSETEKITEKDRGFILGEIEGTLQNTPAADDIISRHISGWTLDRLNKVDLAILRLSLFEMACRHDIPAGVSINEAVELAKVFGDDNSPGFINGVLGRIAPLFQTPGENK